MKMKILGIGLACLTAGTLLAGCGASSSQPTENTTTAIETTITATEAESTATTEAPTAATTEAPATTTAEAWRSKYEDALIQPKKNPEEVWGDTYKVELRLGNGIHIYLPSFFDRFVDGQEGVPGGNVGYGINTGNTLLDYINYDEATNTIHKGVTYFDTLSNDISVGVQEGTINMLLDIRDKAPTDDDKHKYKVIGEKDGEVYFIDFTPPYWDEGMGWNSFLELQDAVGSLDYFNKYADMIADTAWVEKEEKIEKVEVKAQPEDEKIMKHLREFYKSHEIVDGLPGDTSNSYVTLKYTKYAIADFDCDGKNELMLTGSFQGEAYSEVNTKMYEVDNLTEEIISVVMPYRSLEEITFLDNGIAYSITDSYHTHKPLDNKIYYMINPDWFGKLNYNMQYANYDTPDKVLVYYNENGKIMKYLASAQDSVFAPKEKTQEEYNREKQMLNAGKVMDVDIKDFTAENLGL